MSLIPSAGGGVPKAGSPARRSADGPEGAGRAAHVEVEGWVGSRSFGHAPTHVQWCCSSRFPRRTCLSARVSRVSSALSSAAPHTARCPLRARRRRLRAACLLLPDYRPATGGRRHSTAVFRHAARGARAARRCAFDSLRSRTCGRHAPPGRCAPSSRTFRVEQAARDRWAYQASSQRPAGRGTAHRANVTQAAPTQPHADSRVLPPGLRRRVR